MYNLITNSITSYPNFSFGSNSAQHTKLYNRKFINDLKINYFVFNAVFYENMHTEGRSRTSKLAWLHSNPRYLNNVSEKEKKNVIFFLSSIQLCYIAYIKDILYTYNIGVYKCSYFWSGLLPFQETFDRGGQHCDPGSTVWNNTVHFNNAT